MIYAVIKDKGILVVCSTSFTKSFGVANLNWFIKLKLEIKGTPVNILWGNNFTHRNESVTAFDYTYQILI